jgi:hypothetical protein
MPKKPDFPGMNVSQSGLRAQLPGYLFRGFPQVKAVVRRLTRAPKSRALVARRRRWRRHLDTASAKLNWAGILLPFQRNIPHRHMRAQFVFTVAVIFQRLAQPAAGLAIAVAIHVADAGAGMD